MLKIIVVILLMADFAASKRIQQEKAKVTKVLISTGDATGTTEIIDLVNNEDTSCEKLQYDYPIPTRDGIGFNLVDFMLTKLTVICGGYDQSLLGTIHILRHHIFEIFGPPFPPTSACF